MEEMEEMQTKSNGPEMPERTKKQMEEMKRRCEEHAKKTMMPGMKQGSMQKHNA